MGLSKKNLNGFLVVKKGDSFAEHKVLKEDNLIAIKNFIEPTSFLKSIYFLVLFPFYWLKVVYLLIYFKRKKKCRILFCVYLGEKILSTLPARLLGYKVIWLEHTTPKYFLKKNIFKFLFLILSKKANIISVSNHIKHILESYWIKPGKITVIYPGVDIKDYRLETDDEMYSKNNKRFVVGTISDLHANRGVHVLLKAVANAKEFIPDILLIIVGDGPEQRNLVWLAKALNIENNLRIINQDTDIKKWISRFDVFVMPDVKREAFGLNILNAMACGKPVVAPRVDGISELVEQNETGYIIPPNNPDMMAQAFINFYNNQQIIEPMGRKARNRVEQMFESDEMINKFYKIFIS